MTNIVSFSGGKDSTAMLLMMVEKNYRIDEIVFCDTGREFPGMYTHINRVEQIIQKSIVRLSFDFDYWFAHHIKTKGKNKGQKGYGWPYFGVKWCSAKKRDTIKKYLTKFKGREVIVKALY